VNNQIPQFPQVIGDLTIVQFVEIEGDIIGSWFQAIAV